MVLGESPVILLVYVPKPAPSIVFESAVVGFCDVLQQTPRAVTPLQPSYVTSQAHSAVDIVILLMEDRLTEGNN